MSASDDYLTALEKRKQINDTTFGPDIFGRSDAGSKKRSGQNKPTTTTKREANQYTSRVQIKLTTEAMNDINEISASLTVPPSVVARILIGEALAARKAKKNKASE